MRMQIVKAGQRLRSYFIKAFLDSLARVVCHERYMHSADDEVYDTSGNFAVDYCG